MKIAAVLLPSSKRHEQFACALVLWARANFPVVHIVRDNTGDVDVSDVLHDGANELTIDPVRLANDRIMTVDGASELYPTLRKVLLQHNVTDVVFPFNSETISSAVAGAGVLEALRMLATYSGKQLAEGGIERLHAPFMHHSPEGSLFPSTGFQVEHLSDKARTRFKLHPMVSQNVAPQAEVVNEAVAETTKKKKKG